MPQHVSRWGMVLGRARSGVTLNVSVLGRVVLGGFLGVMGGVEVMSVRHMGVMAGLVMVARFVVLGRGFVMLGSKLMVMCCLDVMIGALFRHRNLSGAWNGRRSSGPAIWLCGAGYVRVAEG